MVKSSHSPRCVTVAGLVPYLLCPEQAITEGVREIGVVETGRAGVVTFGQGRIRIGEAMSPPLIRSVKSKISKDKTVILDAPPGASCPVITTVKDSDFVILVTEPTPFGLHDLRIAIDAISSMGMPLRSSAQSLGYWGQKKLTISVTKNVYL